MPINDDVSDAANRVRQENIFYVKGILTAHTLMPVWQASRLWFAQCEATELVINFSQLRTSDSAGLALVITWLQYAKAQHKQLWLDYFPATLLAIAKAARLEALFADNLRLR